MMVAIGTMGIALADVGVQEPVQKLCSSEKANVVNLILRDTVLVVVCSAVLLSSHCYQLFWM